MGLQVSGLGCGFGVHDLALGTGALGAMEACGIFQESAADCKRWTGIAYASWDVCLQRGCAKKKNACRWRPVRRTHVWPCH